MTKSDSLLARLAGRGGKNDDVEGDPWAAIAATNPEHDRVANAPDGQEGDDNAVMDRMLKQINDLAASQMSGDAATTAPTATARHPTLRGKRITSSCPRSVAPSRRPT